jgi:hypothetical protein
MKTAVSRWTLLGEIPRFIETGVVDDQALESRRIQREASWESVIDQLIEWAVNPEAIADDEEGIPAPSSRIIALGGKVVTFLREARLPLPQRTITDGEGGIVFEWWADEIFQMVRVRSNEVVEALSFSNSKLLDSVVLRIKL